MKCFEILKIEPTKDIKIIKKAYAKEIRLHHPEDDEEGYMKVRSAYEEAMAYAKGNNKHLFSGKITTNNNSYGEIHIENKSFVNDKEEFDYNFIDDYYNNSVNMYNNAIKEFETIYNSISTRHDEREWKKALLKLDIKKVNGSREIQEKFVEFFENHMDISLSVWAVIDNVFMFSSDDTRYIYDTIGEFCGYSIYKYMKVIKFEYNEFLKYIPKEKIQEYLCLRSKFESYINNQYENYEIANLFSKLKSICTKDPEIYYLMAIEDFKYAKNANRLITQENKNKQRRYYINRAYENFLHAISIEKDPEYLDIYNKCEREYFKTIFNDEINKIIKKIGITLGVILLIALFIVNEIIFNGKDDLFYYNTFVIHSNKSNYDYKIYGGTLDKNEAINELSENNIKSREDVLSIINYLQDNELSKSFKKDYDKYKEEKTEQLKRLREDIKNSGQDPDNMNCEKNKIEIINDINNEKQKGNDTSKFTYENETGKTKITLYDVTIDDRKDSKKGVIYDIFYHNMAPENNKTISVPDDAFDSFEYLIGNYFTETGYRAGYISFKEALELNKKFTKPLLRTFGEREISVTDFINSSNNKSKGYSNDLAKIYLEQFKDNTLDHINLNNKFSVDDFNSNLKHINTNKIDSQYEIENKNISEVLVKYSFLGYGPDILISTILILISISAYFVFLYVIKIKYNRKLKDIIKKQL